MAKINLLPWREERRKSQQRQFNGMLGLAAVAGLVLSALVYLYYSGQVTGQNQRNELLRQEIAAVEVKIKEIEELDKRKESLLARKKVIEELQGKRYEMVSLFTELAKTIADGAQISTIRQSGPDLVIQGRAQSNARVSSYMRNIMASPVVSDPDLTVIEARGGDRALPYEFILNAKVKAPAAEAGQDAPAAPVQGGAK
ncbi:PilN domain-containing protein [Arenimonas sp. GDDSR-1]|uniref:PilN domain-containing protein n=1 Tax=Arenimonas sp. GDDSR-1 TaxID=2950125 RepID=UPI002630DD29|nr:PilN domain-containing protein [Arenimonas sp. GDDSR-1]